MPISGHMCIKGRSGEEERLRRKYFVYKKSHEQGNNHFSSTQVAISGREAGPLSFEHEGKWPEFTLKLEEERDGKNGAP